MISERSFILIALGVLSTVCIIDLVQSDCGGKQLCSWMDWGAWSTCSNTCGCGVRRSSRELCCSCSMANISECLLDCNLQHRDAFRRERCHDVSNCVSGLELERSVEVYCSDSFWDVQLHVPYLENEFEGFQENDVYLGDPSCVGRRQGGKLVFRYPYTACHTSSMDTTSYVTYRNNLIYSVRGPDGAQVTGKITFALPVKCHSSNDKVPEQHIGNSGGSSGNIVIEVFSDSSFSIRTNLSQVSAGENVYVQVKAARALSTSPAYVNIETCFLQPGQNAQGTSYKYYLFQKRCIKDPFTRLLGVNDKETRFQYRAIEFSSSHDSTRLYCNATICPQRPSFSSGTACFQQC